MSFQELYNKYITLYPDEVGGLKLLADQLNDSAQVMNSRKNFTGHLAASAYIIDRENKKVLLLHHKTLNKLLQPGGHLEEDENSPLAAALREVEEETGLLPADLMQIPAIKAAPEVPLNIDTHYIPENPKKGEPGHHHHDFQYLYAITKPDAAIGSGEMIQYEWIDWSSFAKSPTHAGVVKKIERHLA